MIQTKKSTYTTHSKAPKELLNFKTDKVTMFGGKILMLNKPPGAVNTPIQAILKED